MCNKEKGQCEKSEEPNKKNSVHPQPILFTASGDAVYEAATRAQPQEKKYKRFKQFWKWLRKHGVGVLTLGALIVYTVYTARQWCTLKRSVDDNERQFKQTLCEMESQTRAQQDAADAAQDSADAASDAAVAMGLQVEKLQAGVDQTSRLAGDTETANNIASASLESQTRPWLGITQIEPIDQKAFQPNELVIWFTVHMKNYGGSPAKKIAFGKSTLSGKNQTLIWRNTKACSDAERDSQDPNGLTVVAFPSDTLQRGDLVDFPQFSRAAGDFLVLCIAYQGRVNDLHHTQYLYNPVITGPPDKNGALPIEIRLRDIDAD